MDRLEKVIKELEAIRDYDPMIRVAHDDVFKKYAIDALELLKAQAPRVMTLEEVKTNKVCWIEDKDAEEIYPAIYQGIGNGMFYVFTINPVYDFEHGNEDITRQFDEGERWLEEDDINRWWRPWTLRPNDAQREATPWMSAT